MAGRFGRLDRKALKVLANEQFLIIYTRSRSDAGLGQLRVAPEAFFATFVARSPTERGKSSPLTGFVGANFGTRNATEGHGLLERSRTATGVRVALSPDVTDRDWYRLQLKRAQL